MSDNKTEKRTRKQRQSGGFAVGYEIDHQGEAAVVWLVTDLADTAAAKAWLRENGKTGSAYTIAQVKRDSLQVEVEEVRRAKLV